jgi:hypothetical protein
MSGLFIVVAPKAKVGAERTDGAVISGRLSPSRNEEGAVRYGLFEDQASPTASSLLRRGRF